MIDLYSWDTSNGRKVTILLEELQLEHIFHPIDITRGAQYEPSFLSISPNNKIPAIVDSDGPDGKPVSVFESGAILIYLADKIGSPLFPASPRERMLVLQWLMFQMGGLGPMLGQHLHFVKYSSQQIPYAIERYEKEAHRLLRVLDHRLGEAEFLAGAYSIADIACYPWVARKEWMRIDLADYPHLERWFEAISERPAVKTVMNGDPARYTARHLRIFAVEPPARPSVNRAASN